ncbi:LysR family transcriptional regulator [Oceanibacterium hippocampi]|uniref:HTH-type transcriptional regulator DmlR n=1 Tax=Oceanibacterium hippocampi TaxID=745714 RepID=A0A1Y5SCS0_9PROT|nr:LysR family transcriptional regulator [Oceanibacterium hippocampi]SLN34629.1 HTH-type transcriptional regulator DmlR [Oceanibacterium hippocampi]
MDKLANMAVFAAVVEEKGFSAAARRLGMSKSAVSKQVSRLEDSLGARLLNRTTRSLSLTEIGEVFYGHCARMLEAASDAEAAVSALHGEPRGHLRVALPMTFGIREVAPAVAEFLKRHPAVTIEMELNDRFVDVVADGFDLAVRVAALPDSSLIARRLAPMRSVICASPGYLAEHGTPATIDDLAGLNCLHYSNAPARQWAVVENGRERKVEIRGNLIANNGEALMEAATAGLGITIAPTFIVAEALRRGDLVTILDQCHRSDEASVFALYPHRRHLSPKVRAFIDFLADRFAPTPPWEVGLTLP